MKLPFATNLSLDSLSERDRRTLLIGGVVAALLLLYVVIQLDSSVSSALASPDSRAELSMRTSSDCPFVPM